MQLHFDLRQLKSFVTVAESGSFSRAANILCIAQPALSRQIRLLEESLEVQLFIRHSRGVVLTAAGERLLERATYLLDESSLICQEVAAVSGEVTGEVVFGLIPSVAHSLAGDIIKQFREAFPKVSLVVEVAMSGVILELTEHKKINLAITYEPPQRRNLRCTQLMNEELYLVGPRDSNIASIPEISLKNALKYPLVMAGNSHGLRNTVDRAAEKINTPIIVDTEVNNLSLQLDLVRRGQAHTILPLATVLNSVNRDELSVSRITSPSILRKLVLATPTDKPTSVASLKLQELVEKVTKQQILDGEWPGGHLGK